MVSTYHLVRGLQIIHFNITKVLYLGTKKDGHIYRMRISILGSSELEKTLRYHAG